MYVAIMLLGLAGAAILIIYGIRARRTAWLAFGILLGASTLAFFGILDFWGEMLWFQSLGYEDRFWDVVLTRVFASAGGAILGFLGVYLLTVGLPAGRKAFRLAGGGIAAFIGLQWGYRSWEILLRFLHRVETGEADPIIGCDTGFYLFGLPFLDSFHTLLVWFATLSVTAAGAAAFLGREQDQVSLRSPSEVSRGKAASTLCLSVGAVFLLLAAGRYLDRFHLMYSTWGAVRGAG